MKRLLERLLVMAMFMATSLIGASLEYTWEFSQPTGLLSPKSPLGLQLSMPGTLHNTGSSPINSIIFAGSSLSLGSFAQYFYLSSQDTGSLVGQTIPVGGSVSFGFFTMTLYNQLSSG